MTRTRRGNLFPRYVTFLLTKGKVNNSTQICRENDQKWKGNGIVVNFLFAINRSEIRNHAFVTRNLIYSPRRRREMSYHQLIVTISFMSATNPYALVLVL